MDSTIWTPCNTSNIGTLLNIRTITCGNIWLAYENNHNKLVYSPDGITWTPLNINLINGSSIHGIAYGDSKWIVPFSRDSNTYGFITSADGIQWKNTVISLPSIPLSIAYGFTNQAPMWVAATTASMLYSTDGNYWLDAGLSFNFAAATVTFAYEVWIAVGTTDTGIGYMYSYKGYDWSLSTSSGILMSNPVTPIVAGYLINYSPTYYTSILLLVSDGPNIAYSLNRYEWLPYTDLSGSLSTCTSIVYRNNTWTVAGLDLSSNFTILNSGDGKTWYPVDPIVRNVFTSCPDMGVNPVTGFYLGNTDPGPHFVGDGSITYGTGLDTLNILVPDLTPLTDYTFQFRYQYEINYRDFPSLPRYSDPVYFRTVRTSYPPAPPTNLTSVQDVSNGLLTLTFNWTLPDDYSSFTVYGLGLTGSSDSIYKGSAADSTSRQFTGLDPVRSYTFHIQRGNDAGWSQKAVAVAGNQRFNPRSVAGLNFWVDATDASGSYQPDGTVITTWLDKSGTGNNAGGYGVLGTDSLGRYLTLYNGFYLSKASWAANVPTTFFIVDNPVSLADNILIGTASYGGYTSITYYNNTITLYQANLDNAGPSFVNLGTSFANLGQPVNIWCFTNEESFTAYYNKLVSGRAPAIYIPGDNLLIGSYDQGHVHGGKIREVLMYAGFMTESDREAITNYLFDKWMPQPTRITNLPIENDAILWLDATDYKTLLNPVNAPVTDGSGMFTWVDKSGFGNNMVTASTSGNDYDNYHPPNIYSQHSLNNLPSINTINNGHNFVLRTQPILMPGDATLFIVSKSINGPQHGDVVFDVSGSGKIALEVNMYNKLSWHVGATLNNNQFEGTTNPFIFCGTVKKQQLTKGTYIDVSGATSQYTVESQNFTTNVTGQNPITTGNIPSLASITLGLSPQLYGEIILYNRALSDTDINKMIAYLEKKWKIKPITADPPAQLWLDSGDVYTVFKNGGDLTIWKDRSGHGNHALPQGTLGVSDGIVFEGSQYLSLPNGALPFGPYSYYAVGNFGDSAIVHGGSKDVSGQMWIQVGGFPDGIAIKVTYDLVTFIPVQSPLRVGLGIAYNGSYWVAVGFNADQSVCIIKSIDGFTWTASYNPFPGGVSYGIAWNGDYWVAVGFNDIHTVCIATSTDGYNWLDSISAGGNNPFYPPNGGLCLGIAWGDSNWVAVGFNGDFTVSIARSPDGIHWTPSNTPFLVGVGIAWNGDYWVATGRNDNFTVCIAKSDDGLNWTPSTNNPFSGGQGGSILWNGSFWAAVGMNSSGTVFATSPDGMNWTTGANPFSGAFQPGIAGPAPAPIHNSTFDIKTVTRPPEALYLATSITGSAIIYSNDGVSWFLSESANTVFSFICNSAAYGNGVWVAGGSGINKIAYSTDGITWEPSTSGNTIFTGSCCAAYGNGLWVAGGSGTNTLAYSTDGIKWIPSMNGNDVFTASVQTVSYANGMWFACGSGINLMAYSLNGIEWIPSTSANVLFTHTPYAVVYGNGVWVTGSYLTPTMAYSMDGINWQSSPSGNALFELYCVSIAFANGLFIAAGSSENRMASSIDGINWAPLASANAIFTGNCHAVAYANNKWIAGGGGTNQVAYSTNGIDWTASTSGNALTSQTYGIAAAEKGSYAATTFVNTRLNLLESVIESSTLVDTNPIPLNKTVIIESINNSGKSLFLNGFIGPTDSSYLVTYNPSDILNYIGWDGSGAYMNGTLKELIVYDTAHTSAQRKKIEDYLKKKWYRLNYQLNTLYAGLWLEASAANMTLSGDSVIVWTDLTGNCNVSEYRRWAAGTYTLDPVTGRYGVLFGANAIFNGYATLIPLPVTGSCSIFAVQRYDYSTDQSGELLNGNICSAYETFEQGVPSGSIGTGWVAGGSSANGVSSIQTSTDFTNWVPARNSPFNGCNGIVYNGTYWVAVGYGSAAIATSINGMDWKSVYNTPFVMCNNIAWNGEYWMACGYGSTSIAISYNGVDWISANTSLGSCSQTAWNGSYWVAVGSGGNNIATSSTGLDWTDSYDNPFPNIYIPGYITFPGSATGISWCGTFWLVTGIQNVNEIYRSYFYLSSQVSTSVSTTGLNWYNTKNPLTTYVGYAKLEGFGRGVAWNGFQAIVFGYSYYTDIYHDFRATLTSTTTDGNGFYNQQGIGFVYDINNIVWDGSAWIILGTPGSYSIARSPDGVNWQDYANIFNGAPAMTIAKGLVNQSLNMSLGTTYGTPNQELQFTCGALQKANVEIHKAPVMTSQIVNASTASNFANGAKVSSNPAFPVNVSGVHIGYKDPYEPIIARSMRGYIYELIIYPRPVYTAEQQSIEGYLAWKWGLQDSLPPDHPYAIIPPMTYVRTPSFAPKLLGGMQLWMDAADKNTIGLSPSMRMTRWKDKSGTGNHATVVDAIQYTGNSMFFYGKGYFTTPYTANPTTETLFIVMKYTSGVILDGSAGGGNREMGPYFSNMQINSNSVSGGPIGTNTLPTTTFLYGYTFDTNLNMYLNGSLDATGQTPPFSGASNTLIGSVNGSGLLYGSISEIIIYNSVLSDTQRQTVEGYLAWKWAIQGSLPTSHPYSNAAPSFIPSFIPSSIAGAQLWLDAADATTIDFYKNVSQWNDKSGKGNNASAVGNPTYNGGIVFDGNSYFTLPDGSLPYGNSSYSIYVIANVTDGASIYALIGGGSPGNSYDTMLNILINTAGLEAWWGYDDLISSNQCTLGVNTLFDTFYTSGGNRSVFISGIFGGSNQPQTRIQDNTSNRVGITTTGFPMLGSISEILVYRESHSDAQRQEIEGYLSWKWGIQGSLSPSHRYYNAPPTFIPTSGSMELWLDAADISTLVYRDCVSQWADKSGLGNNTTASIGSALYNGSIVFDGFSYFTLPDGCIPYNDTPYSIYIVSSTTTPAGGMFGAGVQILYSCLSIRVIGEGSGKIQTYWYSNDEDSNALINLNTTNIYRNLYNGSTRESYTNGSYNASSPTSGRTQPSNGNVIGSVGTTPDMVSYSNLFSGTISEILVYSTAHSLTEAQRVEGYLAWKWGSQTSLPISHPYRLEAP